MRGFKLVSPWGRAEIRMLISKCLVPLWHCSTASRSRTSVFLLGWDGRSLIGLISAFLALALEPAPGF